MTLSMRALSLSALVPALVGLLGSAACGFEGSAAEDLGQGAPTAAQPEPGTIRGQIVASVSSGQLGVALLPVGDPLTKLAPCLRSNQALDADVLDGPAFVLEGVAPGTYLLAVSRFSMFAVALQESETTIQQVTVPADGLDVGRIVLPPRLEIQTGGDKATWSVPASYGTAAYRLGFANGCTAGQAMTVTGTYTATAGRMDYVKVVMEEPQTGRFAVRVVNP